MEKSKAHQNCKYYKLSGEHIFCYLKDSLTFLTQGLASITFLQYGEVWGRLILTITKNIFHKFTWTWSMSVVNVPAVYYNKTHFNVQKKCTTSITQCKLLHTAQIWALLRTKLCRSNKALDHKAQCTTNRSIADSTKWTSHFTLHCIL